MQLARNLERRLEQLVDGLAGRLFRGDLGATELATRVVREADLAVVPGPAGPTVPNAYVLAVHPGDVDLDAVRPLERELGAVLAATAAERGWRLDGPARVTIAGDPGLAAGATKCTLSVEPGPLPPWGRLVETPGDLVVELGPNRALVGRSERADAVIPNNQVSRLHAVVWREADDYWVEDLESANGTYVNGSRVRRSQQLLHGDTLRLGPALFEFQVD